MTTKTGEAVRELLATIGGIEGLFSEGPRAARDPQSALEGYRWMFSLLQVALETYVWADPARPRFVDIVGPHLKWGGDNADTWYCFAPVDPERSYRVRGRRGDAAYLSLTVYGGPRDGRYSARIVGTANDRAIEIARDGSFEVVLSKREHAGNWLRLLRFCTRSKPSSGVRCWRKVKPRSWHKKVSQILTFRHAWRGCISLSMRM